jgi:hypothetical protein
LNPSISSNRSIRLTTTSAVSCPWVVRLAFICSTFRGARHLTGP